LLLIGYYLFKFKNKQDYYSDLKPVVSNRHLDPMDNFLSQFINSKFNKFRIYAHNLSSFDGILITSALFYISQHNDCKLEPTIKDNKLISIKLRFGRRTGTNNFIYYIEFQDS